MSGGCHNPDLTSTYPSHDGKCQNCKVRAATKDWVGEGGTLAYVHGMFQRWCDRCVLEAQIEFQKKCLKELPQLEAKLAELIAKEKAHESTAAKENSG